MKKIGIQDEIVKTIDETLPLGLKCQQYGQIDFSVEIWDMTNKYHSDLSKNKLK